MPQLYFYGKASSWLCLSLGSWTTLPSKPFPLLCIPAQSPRALFSWTLALPGRPGHTNHRLQHLLATLHVPKASIFSSSVGNHALANPKSSSMSSGPSNLSLAESLPLPLFCVKKGGINRAPGAGQTLQARRCHRSLRPAPLGQVGLAAPRPNPSRGLHRLVWHPPLGPRGSPLPSSFAASESQKGGGRGGDCHWATLGSEGGGGVGGGAQIITPGRGRGITLAVAAPRERPRAAAWSSPRLGTGDRDREWPSSCSLRPPRCSRCHRLGRPERLPSVFP